MRVRGYGIPHAQPAAVACAAVARLLEESAARGHRQFYPAPQGRPRTREVARRPAPAKFR